MSVPTFLVMPSEGRPHCYFTLIVVVLVLVSSHDQQALANTDPYDVIALEDLYLALNEPPQLKGWKVEGGDPCQESWMGVTCYGSSLIHLKLPGLNLSGTLGTQLQFLHNLKHLDVSYNHIQGGIPYGLPPNATNINLACNSLSQNIPTSLTGIKVLRHLNLSHNSLSGFIGDVFTGLINLKVMDLSYNDFNGDLPPSFGNLTNLTILLLQGNRFTGSVIYLANLRLTDLNIQSNHFSGVIPTQFQSIPNLWMDGNKFHVEPSYPPWNYPLDNVTITQTFVGNPSTESSALENYPDLKARHKKKKLGPGGIACVVGVTTLAVACAAILFAVRIKRANVCPVTRTRDFSPAAYDASPQLLPVKSPPSLGLDNTPTAFRTRNEKISRRKSFANKYNAPTSAKIYSVAEIQSATNNFSEENLIGEGSLGSVYKAEFPEGQILAVRNISMVSLSFQEDEQFLDVVWTASRLRHPNIVTLLGYCVEYGQHLLVYEYVRSLSLDNVLHSGGYKSLPWAVRINIALGVARALEYLHSTFCPSIAHGNIKAANVLLDEDLKPHLCDCGITILRPLTSNSVKLKASESAVGDTGYIAPEHGEPGTDNTKTDIYAFGVLLLELLTGRKPFDSTRPREEQSLAKWASSRLHDSAHLAQMVDPGIKNTLTSKTISRYADIVSLCIQPEKLFRPPMSDIVGSLASVTQKYTVSESGTVEGAEVGPFDMSFHTTKTGLVGSPTPTFYST
ncbi:protein STRUBBELIG-RECEPTOR FAMILY 2 isoform X2 [Mercurialis annua]|uniref:protein STRUBBELIG-RECEPTOR FAMILY 2 isoform X2 n=1 Tax=Mercurialis annua TaxID=3986 RepID=UPI00215E137C|nr:protein STRUBBELIG-RECEPTOR FAMILY 2 isoform X2 [Mercurialis annua]